MNNQEGTGVRAAVYVRVSSTGQLWRDGDEDGYSIPAQQQACKRKAADLGATMAKVYIERAESARSDARPMLQQRTAIARRAVPDRPQSRPACSPPSPS